MTRASLRPAACLLLALAAGCASVDGRPSSERREIEVDAEGWAPLAGADLMSARHRALAEAQKKAIEKAIGVTVRARTRVDDAVNIKQSIEANVGGSLRSYEVTSEAKEQGFFKVRIHAVVIYQPVKAPTPSRPPSRMSVNIASERVAGAVRGALASRDYEIDDAKSDVDVAVTGVVETRGLSDPRLGGFYSYTVKVSLTAVNIRDGKIARVEYEASAADTVEQAACDRALDTAAGESAAALASRLMEIGAYAAAPPF